MPSDLTFTEPPRYAGETLINAVNPEYVTSPPRSRPPRLSPSPDSELYRARDRIHGERNRQCYAKNYTLDHDSRYVNGELVQAAKAYEFGRRDLWPWAPESYKPRGEIENLTRAGALWMAERDRARPDCGSEEAEALASHDCDIEINRIARKIQFLLDAADEERMIRGRVECDADTRETPETPATQPGVSPAERSGQLRRAVQRLQEAARSNPCHDQVRATTTVNGGWNTVSTSYPNHPIPRAG